MVACATWPPRNHEMESTVSVIIAVYNRFHLLTAVIESVLAQTRPVHEVILIDDGSTDETPQELPRLIASRPAWRDCVRYFYQDNQGQSVAFNNGIARARSEWLAFNADDDLWLPQKLEWQFRALGKYVDKCSLCFTDAWFMNNSRMKDTLFQLAGVDYVESLGLVDDQDWLVRHLDQVWVQTIVARADVVRHVGGFDSQIRYQEDQEFLFRMAIETRFCYVSMPMVLIDRTPAEQRHVGSSRDWHREEFRLQMLQSRLEKNLAQSHDLSDDIQVTLCKKLRDIHSQWANWHIRKGQYAEARDSLSKAARYDFTFNIAAKRILVQVAPHLATRVITARDRRSGLDNNGRSRF